MAEAENKPSIRIHVDQQVSIEGLRGHEEVEDATVATEITGFDVEDDLYVLRGALSCSGFFRQVEDAEGGAELPDAFDDRDVFEAGQELPSAPVVPFHHRLPFLLQVPVTAQEVHQRETGSLYVNPKIGQWNVHVLGEETVHLRVELVLQGLSGQEGYVFRCGTQEEGVKPASRLDQLLEQEESRSLVPPAVADEEFEAPFENAWASNYRQSLDAVEEPASEDDWLIESPAPDARTAEAEYTAEQVDAWQAEQMRGQAEIEESDEVEEDEPILFTPDPRMVFPMPEPDSAWAKRLEATEAQFPSGLSMNEQSLFQQAQAMFAEAERQYPELSSLDFAQAPRELQAPFYNTPPSPYAEPFVSPNQAYEANQYREAYERAIDQNALQQEAWQPGAPTHFPDSFLPPFQPSPSVEYHEAYNRYAANHGTQTPAHEEQIPVEEEVFTADRGGQYRTDEEVLVYDAHDPHQEEDDAFVVEDVRAEDVQELEHFTALEEEDRPAEGLAVEGFDAEYEFDDEVPEQETIPSMTPEMVEQPSKPNGPKLSVGAKFSSEHATGLKLSALLGDSRTHPEPSAPEVVDAAHLIRESNTLASLFADTSADKAAQAQQGSQASEASHKSVTDNSSSTSLELDNVPPYYTPENQSNSIWGSFLRQKETKTTLKFRIVNNTDSLHELAEFYNTTASELQRANRLTRQDVEAGQILYIPTKRR